MPESDLKLARKLFRELTKSKTDVKRLNPLIRYRLINETGHSWCNGCQALHPVADFEENPDSDYKLDPSCRKHRVTRRVPGPEVYKPTRKLSGEALLRHYQGQVEALIGVGKRVPMALREAIESEKGISYCRVCRHVTVDY